MRPRLPRWHFLFMGTIKPRICKTDILVSIGPGCIITCHSDLNYLDLVQGRSILSLTLGAFLNFEVMATSLFCTILHFLQMPTVSAGVISKNMSPTSLDYYKESLLPGCLQCLCHRFEHISVRKGSPSHFSIKCPLTPYNGEIPEQGH